MIIKTDGLYYIIGCEKCGTEIRKHKSYCTRYGEAYHFNPELKCAHCGFSAKILYKNISTSSLLKEFMTKKEVGTGKEISNSPGLLRKRMNSKVEIINVLNHVMKELTKENKIGETAKIMLFANFGIIEGTLQQTVDTKDGIQRVYSISGKIRDVYLTKLAKEVSKPIDTENSDYITVFNAKIIPFLDPNHTVTVEVLNLFSDQIAGFTFGEYQ